MLLILTSAADASRGAPVVKQPLGCGRPIVLFFFGGFIVFKQMQTVGAYAPKRDARAVASVALIMAAACWLAPVARAQTWIATAPGLWNDALNWSPQSVPNGAGASAFFASTVAGGSITTGGTVTFNAPVTIGHLSVDMGIGGPFFLINATGSNPLTFDNGAGDATIFTTATSNLEIAGQINLLSDLVTDWRADNGRISAVITGPHNVIADSSTQPFRRLRLWGANTYTGQTIVRNARLSIQSAANLGDATSGTIVEGTSVLIVESSANPTISGEAVTMMDGARMWAISGDWADSIALVNSAEFTPWFDDNEFTISGKLTGDAIFIRGSAQSRFTLDPTLESILTLTNAANDFTSGTIIRSGVLRFSDNAVLGALDQGILFETIGFSEGPPAIVTTADVVIPRDIAMNSDGWLRASAGTTGTYDGVISGARALAIGFVDWTGAVELRAANTYTGGTSVHVGTLLASNAAGSATGSGPVNVLDTATLGGTGAIAGAVTAQSGATVAPGLSAGELTVADITFEAGSGFAVEIGGAGAGQFDHLIANGAATLDGHLAATLINGYQLQPDDEFEVLTASSVNGVFATTDLGPNLEVVYFPDRVVLRAINVQAPCPSDLDGDGAVGPGDLLALLAGFGSPFGPADLLELLANFGTTCP